MYDLSGKHILITGASSGIGQSIAIEASKQGANLTILGRNHERLIETQSSLEGFHHKAICSNLAIFEKIPKLISESLSFNGPIAGFVHCAAIEKTLPIRATTPSIFKEVFDINVFAGFEMIRMLSKKGNFSNDSASFIFISSVVGKKGELGKVAYSASKAAILAGVK
jgi:NAD(P)-dependent dehydrogenase (short-subunit alcohol dehydrogenase family)